jgi:hypothetical protein
MSWATALLEKTDWLSLVIGFLLGQGPWIIARARGYFATTRPIRKFLGPMFNGGLSIITTGGEWQSTTKSQFCDYVAANDAERIFQKQFRTRYSRYTDEEISGDVLKRNLLLVAGPLSNAVTKDVLARVNATYVLQDHDIVDKGDVTFCRKSELSAGGQIVKDYGVITKCLSPFNEDRGVIMAMGCHGWGTQAALAALFDPKVIDFLLQKKTECWEIVVFVNVMNRRAGKPVLEKIRLSLFKHEC